MGGTSGGGRRRRGLTAEDLALWRHVARSVTPTAEAAARAKALKETGAAPDAKARQSTPPGPPAKQAPLKPTTPHRLRAASQPPRPTPSISIHRAPDPMHRLVKGGGVLGGGSSGLDARTADKLTKGKLPPEARLDLHGLTVDRAHHALTAFVHTQFSAGRRRLLVITGKGGRDGRSSGVRPHLDGFGALRTLTPQWLTSPPLALYVHRIFPAPAKFGGDGALYVYLKRNR